MILLIVHHATQVHWSVMMMMMSDHGSRNGRCCMNVIVVVVVHDSVMVGGRCGVKCVSCFLLRCYEYNGWRGR